MPVTTDGTFASFELSDPGEPAVRVRAPGLIVEIDHQGAAEAEVFSTRAAKNETWIAAAEENDLTELGAPIVVRRVEETDSPIRMTTRGDDAPHVEIEVEPEPEDGVLAMVENGPLVQWFIPDNLPAAASTMTTFGTRPHALRFQIPAYALGRAPDGGLTTYSTGTGAARTVIRFFRFKVVRELLMAGVMAVVEYIARQLEGDKVEGIYRFPSLQPVTAGELAQMKESGRVLLLVHGIFSSVEGAFRELPLGSDGLLGALAQRYPERIIGFDHWTVARTPLENAELCLSLLPEQVDLDIVCHSRGALVVRAMLEHPRLSALRQSRIRSVRNAVFVAGANQGSQLAVKQNWVRLLNVFYALGSVPALQGAGVALKLIVGVLKVLAHGASRLPSVEALHPDPNENEFLRDLNGPNPAIVDRYLAVHANFDARGVDFRNVLDLGLDYVFRGIGNDLVVPFGGAVQFDSGQIPPPQIFPFGDEATGQSNVWHTVFFRQPQVRSLLREFLS